MDSIDSDDDMSYSFFADKSNSKDVNKEKNIENLGFGVTPPAPIPIFTKRTREKWVEDSSVDKCKSCNSTFRIYRRRHHCRMCCSIFCDYCTRYREKIPRIIKKIPTKSGKEEDIDYNTPVRLCLNCYNSFRSIYKIEELFTVFSLLKLDLQDLKKISLVCKQWNLIGAFYLSKFREIQYKLPNYSYNSWEKQILWTNRLLLKNHSIWEVHVLRSLKTEPEKFSEAVNIYFGENKKKIKPSIAKKIKELKENENKKECWFRMCSRYCKKKLDPERALLLLDVLKIENNIVAKEITQTFNNLSDYNLECYLPYILYKLTETSNVVLKEFIFERCSKSLRIANCCYWYFKINNKKYLSGLLEKLPEFTSLTIFRAENFVNLIRGDDVIEGKMISVVAPELGDQEIFTDKIHIKDSATRPTFIPLENSAILFKKDDIRKDYIVICVIRLMEKILKENGLDINVVTYNVQPTSENDGVIEIVENCETLYSLSEKLNTNIINFLLRNNPNESVINLRNRFKESCAFYSVVAFLLSISDRNTENLMVTTSGDFLNIDFNQIMGENFKPLKASCVRITSQMLDALGGENSKEYEEFKELCGEIYTILRRHVNTFICLLSLIMDDEKMYLEIIKRFCPGETSEDALKNIKNRVDNSVENLSFSRYHVIDFFHKYSKESSVGNFFESSYSNSKSYLSSIYSYLYNGK
jgi:Phosphatidylinositol 3- and 4-kinase/FYVE zinc finger